MTLGDSTIQKFATLQTWKRKGERAHHKPLLALLALGQLQRGEERLIAFNTWEPELKRLLIDFGPPRHSSHPEYPFWRLQTDGVWEVQSEQTLVRRRGSSDPLKSVLRSQNVSGGFTRELYKTLKAHPEIVRALGSMLLDAHFPSSLHTTIAMAVGLELEATTRNSQRDASFDAK